MIEFETPKPIAQLNYALQTVAENMMRPYSRYYDDHEHEVPWEYITFMHSAMAAMGAGSLAPENKKHNGNGNGEKPHPHIGYQRLANMLEMLSWGDTGMYLVTPGGGLGAAAVQAAGTPEQKQKFLARFLRRQAHFRCDGDDRTPGGLRHLGDPYDRSIGSGNERMGVER